jgi:WD40 repeat protein
MLIPPITHKGTIEHAAFSPDGSMIVTASDDNTARVWNTATGEALTPPLLHHDWGKVTDAAFSPDGQWVATASEDGTARLWKLEKEERPLDALLHFSRVMTGFQVTSGTLLPILSEELAQDWKEFKKSR